MASTTGEDLERIFRPLRVLSPLSITVAATNLYSCAMYRAYNVLSLASATVFSWYLILASENQKFIPFNKNGVIFTAWTLIFILNGYLIITFGKSRVRKLTFEIQKLDILLSFSDQTLVRNMIAHNMFWVASIIAFHVSAAVISVELRNDSIRIGILILFSIVDIAMKCEVACFSCLTIVSYTRVKYFVSRLNLALVGKRRDKGTDAVSCYRQIHRVLRRAEKAFQAQVALAICFNFYSCLRILVTITQFPTSTYSISLNIIMLARYVGIFVVLGALGQAVASQLDQVRGLAMVMEHSPNGELYAAGRGISAEAEVRGCGLRALGFQLDARLPLRACAALAAAVILLLQLGVDLADE